MLRKQELSKYLDRSKYANTEASKALQFLFFVKDVFREVDIDYFEKRFPRLEKYISGKENTIVKRGRIDASLENLLIEFKKDLIRNLEDAEKQLRDYIAILWNNEKHKVNYLAIASDGIHFHVYRPRTSKDSDLSGEDIKLDEIDRKNFEEESPEEIFTWLDRYFLTQEFLIPKTESFSREFGSGSSLFKSVKSDFEDAISEVEKNSNFQTIFNEWSKYLAIVYGSSVENKDLFIRHTYLSILSKLMVYSFYSKGEIPSERVVEKILSGGIFEEWGIKNFIVEDFFVWIIRDPLKEKGISISKKILKKLSKYDLSKLDEDVLKGLYQELVDPEERHDLGEYYTPDWLAEYMLRELLKKKPMKRLLDPACGSGTFLFTSIKLKKEMLKKKMKSKNILYHIINSVVGMDIHPLAVIIAKTNYLLSLGDLLQKDRGEVILPIYMADSIRLMEEEKETFFRIKNYKIPTLDNETFFLLPADLLDKHYLDPEKIDQLIEIIEKEAKKLAEDGDYNKNIMIDFLRENTKIPKKDIEKYSNSLKKTIETFSDLIKKKRNTIWAFIFKNKYKPLYLLSRPFDLVVGNPPWLTYNSVKNVDYQNFLKKLILEKYGLTKRAELITHMELATLFFVRCSELYLKDEGIISFVMPRSIFMSDHHSNFRKGKLGNLEIKLYKLLDLENVKPLFNVPSCVIFGMKNKKTTYPIFADIFEGKLENKNEKYKKASQALEIRKSKLHLSNIGDRNFFSEKHIKLDINQENYYLNNFADGATIYPRQFWFIDFLKLSKLGFNKKIPNVTTSNRALKYAKKPYKDVKLKGNIESEFIFGTLTGSELTPFGFTGIQTVILPIEIKDKIRLLNSESARNMGKDHLYDWLKEVEEIWKDKRGKKAQKMSVEDYLNYRNKLLNQKPKSKFKVVYNAHGKYLTSCVIKLKDIRYSFNGYEIELNGFFADHALFYYGTDDEKEAYYLTSILNSNFIDDLIKPMQAKGLFGHRSIHKKPLEIPIPKFDSKNKLHKRLSEMGKICEQKVEEILPELSEKYKSIGKIRSVIRNEIDNEIEEIDELFKKVLSETKNKSYGLKKYING